MKKSMVIMAGAALGMALLVGTGCASNPQQAQSTANVTPVTDSGMIPSSANVDTEPTKVVVKDWSNRTMGMPTKPAWLQALVLGNTGPVKETFTVNGADRVKYSLAQRRNRDEARVQAGLLFAAKTANELKQYVVTGAGQVLDDGEMDIVEEIATATKVTITGNRNVADFWQLVEVEDVASRQKTQEYLYWIVYSMDDSTWRALVRKYTNDIIGKLPDRAVQTKVAQAFADIDAAATREREQTEAGFKAQVAAQEQAARDAQAREIARINAQTAQNQAASDVARTQVQAEANARRAAYRSGDPAVAAAASTTAADFDWISALGTAAKVVF